MGKDSKLTEHIVQLTNIKYEAIFNNTTCDSADVYREVKNQGDIKIITPKDSSGNNFKPLQNDGKWNWNSKQTQQMVLFNF